MADQTVVLADAEWAQVMAVLANATGAGINWAVTNPLLMRIGDQLRQQTAGAQQGLGSLPMSNGLDPEPERIQRRPTRQ